MAFNGEVFEIFSWMPAKALYKFASVSRQCSQLVREDFFRNKQSENMQSKDELGFFIQPNSFQTYRDLLELHPLPGEASSFGVPQNPLHFLSNTSRLLASSNGLLCCRSLSSKQPELFLCNPATGNRLPIPTTDGLKLSDATERQINVAFRCNHNDCEVLAVMEYSKDWSSNVELECKMYSLKERRWKEGRVSMMSGSRNLQFEMPVWQNGTVYVLSDCSPYLTKNSPFYWPYIVACDVEKLGKSRFLRVPKEARKGLWDRDCKMGIFKWKHESICLVRVRKLVISAWVLMDPNSNSWNRIVKIRLRAMGLMEMEPEPSVAGFTVLNGNSLLIATRTKIYSYNLLGDRRERVKEVCRHGWGRDVVFYSYSNSLRPCGDGATPLLA